MHQDIHRCQEGHPRRSQRLRSALPASDPASETQPARCSPAWRPHGAAPSRPGRLHTCSHTLVPRGGEGASQK